MARVEANNLEFEYETFGSDDNPTVILIAGLGSQLTFWHEEFCEALVERGAHVVRVDNRDVGLSSKLDDLGVPSVVQAMMTLSAPDPPYTLEDMADDVLGLVDALGLDGAHLVGMSLGGMVAQNVAARHDPRIRSLVAMSTTSGSGKLPRGSAEAWQAILTPPVSDPSDHEQVVERGLRIWGALAGEGYPTPDDVRARWVLRDHERSFYPQGLARQLYASVADGSRSRRLAEVTVPTVALHGSEDPLFPVACAEHIAESVQNGRVHLIEGMGHDFPLAVIEEVADVVWETVAEGETA